AIPAQRPNDVDEATTALSAPRQDPERTEKLNAPEEGRRGNRDVPPGGGLSAQELLRREGRL
ncbi:hypothetical protein, partial [uncultured Mycolicibacterium sp.]|uniref:hypothetical protein n=1 Tax=uncultured Mycolicibacterium sp. TaxID=2320817 RepID=UPI002616A537